MTDELAQRALAMGRTLRQQFQATREAFTATAFATAFADALAAEFARTVPGFARNEKFERLAAGLAAVIDDEALHVATDEELAQRGQRFDLAGEYRLAGGRRIAKPACTREQFEESMAIDDAEIAVLNRRIDSRRASGPDAPDAV